MVIRETFSLANEHGDDLEPDMPEYGEYIAGTQRRLSTSPVLDMLILEAMSGTINRNEQQ